MSPRDAKRVYIRPTVPRVYVQMRVVDYASGKLRHVRGKTIIFEKYTPEQVYDLIVNAGREAHERAKKAREAEDGKENTTGSGGGDERDGSPGPPGGGNGD